MKHRLVSLRSIIVGALFLGSMGFGAMQAIATDSTAPGVRNASCSAWACTAECPEFGGDYIRGRCYCCG